MKIKIYILCLFFQILALQVSSAFCLAAELSGNGAPDSEQQYQHALALNRQNKADEALVILDNLRHTHPEIKHYLYDYIAVASWSGHHDLVIAVQGWDLNVAPAYVLEAVGSSQRQLENYDAAIDVYDLVIKRFPERVDAQLARVNTLIDAQRYEVAEADLLALRKKYPDRRGVMEVALRLSDDAKAPINTLSEAEKILSVDPDNIFALKMRFYALRKLGAAHLASRLTPDSILSASERISVERDRLAFELRWARIDADRPEQVSRWKKMDAVIARLERICKTAEDNKTESDEASASCGDLVAALSDRKRTIEAIALYEKMLDKKWLIEPYVQAAAAEAYLDQQQPEIARSLFETSLEKDPDDFWVKVGYIYSLLDSEQYQEAYRQVDQLAEETKEWISTDVPNSTYPQAQLLRAQIRSYTNRLAEAESRLQSLAFRAPANIQIRQALASNFNSRGWHRRAEKDLEWLYAAEPNNVWTRLGLFESRMAIGDYRGAEQQLKDAVKLLPDERSVQRAQREWETHNLRELVVDSNFGRSSDAAASSTDTRESVIDARLYSSPFNYKWRAFLHTQISRSTLPGFSVNRNAVGGGVEYQIRDFRATGEISGIGNIGIGIALAGAYQIDDHWSINGSVESKSLSAPIKGYVDGILASNTQVGGGYRWHESRNVILNINQMSFSDGNNRSAVDAFWTEGLLTSATYILDATAEYYVSRNSSQSPTISYFNPISDKQVGITFRNEWRQYHRYDKSLTHVLSIGFGNYDQQNFPAGRVWNIGYELLFTPANRLDLRFGISRNAHPYDGINDAGSAVSFGMGWRFQ